jgi:CRP-like cAMP-binding protein
MSSKNEYIEYLRRVPLFSSLNKRDISAVAKAGDELDFAAGHELITEGTTGSEAYILLSGNVTVTRKGTKLAKLGPGDIIGELALLDQSTRTASVVCDTDCSALVIDRRHFTPLIERSPALGIRFLAELAARLRNLDRTAYG